MNMKILKRCKTATIYDDEKNLLCQANVIVDKDETTKVSVSRGSSEKLQKLFGNENQQKSVEVVFIEPVMGLFPCRCVLTEPYSIIEEVVIYRCIILEQGEQIQRRNDIKVPVEINLAMRTDSIAGGIIELANGGYLGTMKDISAGGVYIVSKMRMDVGARIDFKFEETKIPVDLSVEVLRVVEKKDDKGDILYGHGCRFIEMTRGKETQVRNFVFQKERELYKNDIW